MDPSKADDDRLEAERLALLPVEDQEAIIRLHRSVAGNPQASKADLALAERRADALTRHLRSLRKESKKRKQ